MPSEPVLPVHLPAPHTCSLVGAVRKEWKQQACPLKQLQPVPCCRPQLAHRLSPRCGVAGWFCALRVFSVDGSSGLTFLQRGGLRPTLGPAFDWVALDLGAGGWTVLCIDLEWSPHSFILKKKVFMSSSCSQSMSLSLVLSLTDEAAESSCVLRHCNCMHHS